MLIDLFEIVVGSVNSDLRMEKSEKMYMMITESYCRVNNGIQKRAGDGS